MTKSPLKAAAVLNSESLTIDPVATNIVNRIAPQTRQSGELICEGGLLIEGRVSGNLIIRGGPLVLRATGVICGSVRVEHDAYLLGTIEEQQSGDLSELVVKGTAFLGSTLNAAANIQAVAMKTFEGSRIDGRIRTGQWAEAEENASVGEV